MFWSGFPLCRSFVVSVFVSIFFFLIFNLFLRFGECVFDMSVKIQTNAIQAVIQIASLHSVWFHIYSHYYFVFHYDYYESRKESKRREEKKSKNYCFILFIYFILNLFLHFCQPKMFHKREDFHFTGAREHTFWFNNVDVLLHCFAIISMHFLCEF